MEQQKFRALIVLIVPQIIELIVKHDGVDEISAAKDFYQSKVYSLLEEEETKIWQLSPLTIYHMYHEEQSTGKITFPEG